MKRTICPYLGLREDPTTALQFPSNGNFCHHARPIAPVKGAYQQKYCLTSDHVACPLYQAAKPMALPAALAVQSKGHIQGRRVAAILGIPLVVAAAAALGLAWNTLGFQLLQPRVMPDTGGSKPVNNSLFSGVLGSGTTQTAVVPADAPQPPAPSNCPLPSGWTTYNVNPTDSLFRLSVIYGVSVEEFQKVNCFGDRTVILPGQVIYVPFIPTNTPIPGAEPVYQAAQPVNGSAPQINPPALVKEATNTPQPGLPNKPAVAPSATNTNASVPPSDTPVPASSTPVINTPVVPTNTSAPPATNTSAPTAVPPTPRPSRTAVPPSAVPRTPTSIPPTLPPTLPPPTNTSVPPTAIPPTAVPSTSVPTTAVPPTAVPPTAVPPTSIPPTDVPPTIVPATTIPPTDIPPTAIPPTDVPPTDIPPTDIPPTAVQATEVPPTAIPPTDIPPTAVPLTEIPPTDVPPTDVPPTDVPPTDTSPTAAPAILP